MKVNILERIKELALETEIELDGEFTYTYHQGYETLVEKYDQKSGSANYAGSYHPNAICEGQGICKWCGCTLFNY